MVQQYQNNPLQTLKQQRAQLFWKEIFPLGLLCLALGCFCLYSHFFIWWGVMPFTHGVKKKFARLAKLNAEIRQHIEQSGYRIQDEYPPRMVGL